MNPPGSRLDVVIIDGRPLWRIFYGNKYLVSRDLRQLLILHDQLNRPNRFSRQPNFLFRRQIRRQYSLHL